jgi:hypothetical protein
MKTKDAILYHKALKKWGDTFQLIMVLEECAELQHAVTKLLRGKINYAHVLGEIADVEIMLEQLKIIISKKMHNPVNKTELFVTNRKQFKLNRLAKMLEG